MAKPKCPQCGKIDTLNRLPKIKAYQCSACGKASPISSVFNANATTFLDNLEEFENNMIDEMSREEIEEELQEEEVDVEVLKRKVVNLLKEHGIDTGRSNNN